MEEKHSYEEDHPEDVARSTNRRMSLTRGVDREDVLHASEGDSQGDRCLLP